MRALYDCDEKSEFYADINATLKVVNSGALTNEVKKVGVIIDRGQEI